MDIQYLNRCVQQIEVTNLPYEDVKVENHSPLIMIGKGRQGAVFQYNEDIAVKVFGNEEDCEREYYALSLGQHTDLFPKLHDKGSLHIAMDFIRGVDVREYLQSQPLTEELSMKLIQMLITFKEIGYERIDHHKRQIYIQFDGSLKVIDVARTVWRDRVYPYPRKLINSLGEKNNQIFLSHVQAISPELYEEWSHYIQMEEASREITKLLLTQSSDKALLNTKSDLLKNSTIEAEYLKRLEDLAYKVFKDEWVKVMLAKGVNPDLVMEKIDDHWKKLENKLLAKEIKKKNDQLKGDYVGYKKDKDQSSEKEKKKSYDGYTAYPKSDSKQKKDSRPSKIYRFRK